MFDSYYPSCNIDGKGQVVTPVSELVESFLKRLTEKTCSFYTAMSDDLPAFLELLRKEYAPRNRMEEILFSQFVALYLHGMRNLHLGGVQKEVTASEKYARLAHQQLAMSRDCLRMLDKRRREETEVVIEPVEARPAGGASQGE